MPETRSHRKKEPRATKGLRYRLVKPRRRITSLHVDVSFVSSLVIIASLFFPISANADDVYTWTDAHGRVHYSTKPQSEAATKAELPALRTEDLDQKIRTIKNTTPPNCEKHGGEDCSRGADSDGSVICLDGHRGALLPFRFHCVEARVESNVRVQFRDEPAPEPVTSDTLKKARRRPIFSLLITVRNLSGVEARGMKVSAVVSQRTSREFQAQGPAKVEPFGLADYTVPLDNEPRPLNVQELKTLRGRVKCENCR